MAKRKSHSIVCKILPVLQILRHCSRLCTFKSIVKDKTFRPAIAQAIRELAYNYLFVELPLTKKQKLHVKSKLHLLKRLCKEKKISALQKIIINNHKTVIDVILEPITTSLKEFFENE